VSRVSHAIDRVRVSFDDPNLVANAGLLLVGTLVVRLELERLVNATVRLRGRVGGAHPGRKVLTLVHAMVAGASHIDHADVLRSGGTAQVLPFRVRCSVGDMWVGARSAGMPAAPTTSTRKRSLCAGAGLS
jgi:hypothetical protein